MDKRLSILHSDKEIDLQANKSDLLAALFRGMIGAAPIIGPMIAETITIVIPDQKSERITRWAEIFEMKFDYLKEDLDSIRNRLQSAEGSDLLEDSLNQAARAINLLRDKTA